MTPIFSRSWLMKMSTVFDFEIAPVSLRSACDMTSEDIAWYVETGEWHDKAGAYGIQGKISRFVARVEGSYTNVVGLPVSLVCGLLMRYPEGRGAFRSTP